MSRVIALGFCALVIAALGTAALAAQDEKITTLHAYSNLVQIPVLVLGHNRKPMPPIAERRFFVSLDNGPRFRVTHARLEGDDPISLAILLDLRQPDPRLIKKIDDAIAGLSPVSLHAIDHVSVYSMDCSLERSTEDTATDATTLKQHVDVVLASWRARGQKRAKDCQKPWQLWDSIAAITRVLSRQPGRRVILAVTDGIDQGSKNPWNEVREFAQERGVAIFGLIRPEDPSNVASGIRRGQDDELIFNSLCELTGGFLLTSEEKDLAKQLAWFVTLVRARYIVEFPRPRNTTVGHYGMEITIEKTSAFIRSTGIGLPVDDPAILNDPTTVPSDPSNAPALGKRKMLAPH